MVPLNVLLINGNETRGGGDVTWDRIFLRGRFKKKGVQLLDIELRDSLASQI